MLPPDKSTRRGGRRKPDLNIDTSPPPPRRARDRDRSRDKDRDLVPQTPTGRPPTTPSKDSVSPGGAALRLPEGAADHTADIETFLESLTPVDIPIDMSNPEHEHHEHHEHHDHYDRPEPRRPNPRDSHDLSLSPRQVTRDSLVTNMLLSLDQLSMGQISTSFGGSRTAYDEPAIYPPFATDDTRAMTFNSRPGRGNGHGYSYSSDFEGTDISSRGRRSNSSSGFQSGLGRINSMRETSQRSPGRAMHSRGGKGSKNGSTSSVDAGGYAQVLGSQRWARGFGRRSSSFDGEARPPAGPWHVEFSSSFFNDGYDAAPTPNVPGGTRKLTTVPSLPVLSPSELKTEPKSPARGPGVERRRSTRSSRSATVGRKPEPKFNTARDAPPLPALDLDSAPAPNIGYEKTKDAGLAPPSAAHLAKEKPGFFRRMFGSSKSTISSSSPSLQVSAPADSPLGKPASVLQSKSAPPSRDSPQSTTHTLQKKTSSFFRRRKHSVTDSETPPMPNMPAAPAVKLPLDRIEARSGKPEPSPITSLRRAMDPFLQGSPASTAAQTPVDTVLPSIEMPEDAPHHDQPSRREAEEECGPTTRGFSPDYDPSPNAVIRKVEPEPSGDAELRPIATPNRQPPEFLVESPPKSFLRDNSDSEDSPVRQRKAPRSEPREKSLRPTHEQDGRTRSPSPVVAKSKSVPNLNKAARQDAKQSSISRSDRKDSNTLGLEPTAETMYKPALPSLRIDSAEPSPKGMGTGESVGQSAKSIDEPEIVMGDPTEDDRQKAQKIFEGSEDYIAKDKAAAWMGEEGIVRQRTLRAYMDLYDFENQSIVASLRQVCQRLLLRAETQQVDRILVAFAKRWCECNPNHGFKTSDIIHTICYSIILLNTDLHVADIEHRMTRSQFIKNTMTTIRQAVQESAPEAFERPSILPGKGGLGLESDPRTSEEHDKHRSFRASFKPPPRPGSALGIISDQGAGESCGPLVKAPFDGTLRAWESQVEIVLKDIYSSIRDDRLPLFGAESSPMTPSSLSVMGMLKRSPSVLSKAPSEGVASTRGRISEAAKANSSRWNSKSRSRPRGFGTGFSSSRTSFEDGNSVWSPTDSSATWSKVSLGRTHTSMSMDSFGSSYPRGDFQQSIGFANALSQAIIREDSALEALKDEIKNEQLLDDESLELAGPPWVKEGIVTHKHHLDGIDKKAKDRNWSEVFAVIQKGQLSLFSFSPNKSLRNKNRRGLGNNGTLPKGAVVGGGNWQDNATNLGTFSLRQTLASALPPPGYSRSRPHVWALSLPTGAVHLFQVGTPEISREFVSTANYWSARLSTHPLVGGISNIEYGWSEPIINNALVSAINDSATNVAATATATATAPGRRGSGSTRGHSRPGSAANAAAIASAIAGGGGGGRSSMQSGRSMRSASFDFVRPGSGSSGVLGMSTLPRPSHPPHPHHYLGKLPGDRIHITDWSPPTQSMRPSALPEREQLEYLMAYVRSIEAELQAHNALRSPMLLAFSPRSGNAARAMANWERKSEYLLREIVKFRTYVDCLQQADQRRGEIYRERETARRAARGEDVDDVADEEFGDAAGPVPGSVPALDVDFERGGEVKS
ncbi:Cytohesin-4 [Madurella mycetomatis]|uniref:Cytohesin-4 n=1 Tax=Madurella mycetomatis TaxID=100816 RepID=A0A175VU25_9PEZI|nr:Cytohesin-4 [Madurella mycetomatis]